MKNVSAVTCDEAKFGWTSEVELLSDDFNDIGVWWNSVNTLKPRQDGRHFPDNISKCIFLHENVWISIKISLKFVPKSPINNIPALGQIMACHPLGGKPLSETMMVSLLTHIYGSFGLNEFTHAVLCHIWRPGNWSTLFQVMACCLMAPSHYLNQVLTWCQSVQVNDISFRYFYFEQFFTCL